MTSHAQRAHATWSASATKRNCACPGALALTVDLPERSSEAADWGTCAHQISEACLRDGGNADRFLGTIQKGKEHEFEVDEEMAECAQTYIDYVRSRVTDPRFLWVETKFVLNERFDLPLDAGGTADAVVFNPETGELEVIDLKGGRGVVVEAVGNPQGRTYALGALSTLRKLNPTAVRVTIVQPRAPHRDGRIRSEIFDVLDLSEWASEMIASMRRAAEAIDARKTMGDLQWSAAYLNPGPHCADTFCGAAGFCPALAQRSLDAIGMHFDPITEAPSIQNAPESGTPAERAARLDMLDMIDDWVKAVRAHEHRMAEMGQPAEGYGLVAKRGREKWVDGGDAKALALAETMGVPRDALLNAPKIRTPKQVADAFKKAKVDLTLLAGLSETPETGTNLVKLSESLRPAATPAVHQHFNPIT